MSTPTKYISKCNKKIFLKKKADLLKAESSYCSVRGPRFGYQHVWCSPQPAPGTRSVCGVHTHIQANIRTQNKRKYQEAPGFDYLCSVPFLTLKRRRLLSYVNPDVTLSSSCLPVSSEEIQPAACQHATKKGLAVGQVTRDGRLLISRRQTGDLCGLGVQEVAISTPWAPEPGSSCF